MREPLRSGRITHQRQRDDGTWEETLGWLSVDEFGNVALTVLTEAEVVMSDRFSDCFTRGLDPTN